MSKIKNKKSIGKKKNIDREKALAQLKWYTSPLPQPQVQSPSYEEVRQLIKQSDFLWHNRFVANPEPDKEASHILGRNVGELLHSLLSEETETQDWGAAIYSYTSFMMDLLVLLAKPGVLDQLPDYSREKAADRLSRLHAFFTGIDFKDTYTFLDFIHCGDTDAEGLQRLTAYYDFSKRMDHPDHGNFFETAGVKKQDANMQALYNQRFKE